MYRMLLVCFHNRHVPRSEINWWVTQMVERNADEVSLLNNNPLDGDESERGVIFLQVSFIGDGREADVQSAYDLVVNNTQESARIVDAECLWKNATRL